MPLYAARAAWMTMQTECPLHGRLNRELEQSRQHGLRIGYEFTRCLHIDGGFVDLMIDRDYPLYVHIDYHGQDGGCIESWSQYDADTRDDPWPEAEAAWEHLTTRLRAGDEQRD